MITIQSVFIERSGEREIPHLCYSDGTRQVLSDAQFRGLLPDLEYDSDNGIYWYVRTPQDAPGTNEGKKVVLVHRANGQTETDADLMARQAELEDLRQTQDAASYRQGV